MSTNHLSLLALAGVLGADAALMPGCCPAQRTVEERHEQKIAALMAEYEPAPVRIVEPGTDREIEPEDVAELNPVADVLSHSRWVEGNTLVSTGLPEFSVDIDPAFSFVGSTRYELLGEVAAEAFIFADSVDGVVNRKLTFVFEGALPDSEFTYAYGSDDSVTLGADNYSADSLFAWGMSEANQLYPQRDSAIHDAYIQSAGLTQPDNHLIQRFVNITSPDSSSECIIAYTEDLASTGYTESDLEEFGPFNHMIPDIETSLRERALASFTVKTNQ